MRRISRHLSFANVASAIALFVALGGGTAVALNGSNTIFSDDIVNNQVQSADVRDDNLSSGGLQSVDLKNNAAVTSSDVVDENVPGGGIKGIDIAPGVVRGTDVGDNSLTGADIAESTLDFPSGTTHSVIVDAPFSAGFNETILATDGALQLVGRCRNTNSSNARDATVLVDGTDTVYRMGSDGFPVDVFAPETLPRSVISATDNSGINRAIGTHFVVYTDQGEGLSGNAVAEVNAPQTGDDCRFVLGVF
jgi:hypothetical protein